MNDHSFISVTDWLSHTAELGVFTFLFGALLQYLMLRFLAQRKLPESIMILVISRIISLILAWVIWLLIGNKIYNVMLVFIFIPALISEALLAIFTYFVLRKTRTES